MSHVVCRPTRREAEEFYHYFAEEMADAEGQAYYRRQRGPMVKDAAGNEIRRPLVNRFMRATGQALRWRVSRHLSAGRHAGRHRCRHGCR